MSFGGFAWTNFGRFGSFDESTPADPEPHGGSGFKLLLEVGDGSALLLESGDLLLLEPGNP